MSLLSHSKDDITATWLFIHISELFPPILILLDADRYDENKQGPLHSIMIHHRREQKSSRMEDFREGCFLAS